MDPPALTRYRRPFFLAPLWLSLLAAVLVAALGLTFYRSAGITVVLVVRAAEKDPGIIADPPISPAGEERAQRLANMLGGQGAGPDAIYVSDDRRAQQTAAPVVERLHHAAVVFPAAEGGATADRILREHSGGTVLVIAGGVGFTPLLRRLADAEVAAVPEDTNVIYMVSVPTFGRAHLVRLNL